MAAWPAAVIVGGGLLLTVFAGCQREVRLRINVEVADGGTTTSSVAKR